MRSSSFLLTAGLLICFENLTSCEKGAGEGGTSSIEGKVYVLNYNNAGQLISEYYGSEERVYIIYGDADFYGNDTRTSFDGIYRFDYLRKGHYTVFAYSNCDTCASGVEAKKLEVDITRNNSLKELPDLVLRK